MMAHPWLTGTIRDDEAPAARSTADQNKPLEEEEEARRRIRERASRRSQRLDANNEPPLTLAELPVERMRQSTNVIDLSRAKPPAPDLADLMAGRFVPNAEYGGRMLMPGDPADPLPAAVGLNDIGRSKDLGELRSRISPAFIMPENERRNPRPGRVLGEGSAGGGLSIDTRIRQAFDEVPMGDRFTKGIVGFKDLAKRAGVSLEDLASWMDTFPSGFDLVGSTISKEKWGHKNTVELTRPDGTKARYVGVRRR